MWLVMAVFAVISCGMVRQGENSVVDGDGKLKSTLVLRTRLTAFTVTLQVWTIEPQGRWKWEHLALRDGADKPVVNDKREGKLTDAQMAKLIKTLQEAQLNTGPESVGRDGEINFLNVEIEFGKRTVAVRGLDPPTNGDIVQALRDDAHVAGENKDAYLRIGTLAAIVLALTNEE